MTYSVILPTLNEKGHIIELIKKIRDIFTKNNLVFEIIIVDDNSSDGTIAIVENFIKNNSFVRLHVRKDKRSLPDSLNDGINLSYHKKIIWMDADFQHPPEYIQDFINLSDKSDAIICSRFLEKSNRYFNINKLDKDINENQSLFFNTLCKNFIFNDITDFTSGYICVNKNVLKNYHLHGFYGDYFLNFILHLKQNKFTIIEIPFSDNKRKTGLSKTVVKLNYEYIYTCFRYLLTFLKVLTKIIFVKIKF